MIKIYKFTDQKKGGGLKKSAKGLFFNNTDEHGKADRYETIAELIKAEGFTGFKSPYVFTAIYAKHPVHGDVFIKQDVQGFTCSPIKLLEALNK